MPDGTLPAADPHGEMAGWRHEFHRTLDLGFEEYLASDRNAALLADFGLEVHRGLGGTGIVGALQTIVSRKLNPGLNGVVSVTEFITDGGRNILPGSATLLGEARALTPETNQAIEAAMHRIVDGICAAHGLRAKVEYKKVFPAVINSAPVVQNAVQAARRRAGDGLVDGNCEPKLFSEDFAHRAAARSACFMLMGNGTNGAHARPLHSTDYDYRDAALLHGSSSWVGLVDQHFGTR